MTNMTTIHFLHHELFFVKKILEYLELDEETLSTIPAFRNWHPDLISETMMEILRLLQIQEDGIRNHKDLSTTFENLEDGSFHKNLLAQRKNNVQ